MSIIAPAPPPVCLTLQRLTTHNVRNSCKTCPAFSRCFFQLPTSTFQLPPSIRLPRPCPRIAPCTAHRLPSPLSRRCRSASTGRQIRYLSVRSNQIDPRPGKSGRHTRRKASNPVDPWRLLRVSVRTSWRLGRFGREREGVRPVWNPRPGQTLPHCLLDPVAHPNSIPCRQVLCGSSVLHT